MPRNKLHFVKPKIRQQLIFTGIFLTFIPLFCVGLFALMQARNQMSVQMEDQVTSAALRVNSTIFDITTSLYTSIDPLLSSSYARKLFGVDSEPEDLSSYELVSNSLATMHSTTAAISSITIYTDNPNIPSNSNIVYINDNYSSLPWAEKTKNTSLNSWLCLTNKDSWDNSVYELAIVRKISLSSTKYSAYLEIRIDANYLKNRLLGSDYIVMASVDNTPTFYSSDRSWLQKKIPFPEDFNNEYYQYTGPIIINDKKLLCNIVTFLPYKTDNKFYICVIDPNAYNNLNRITLTYIVILIIATLFPIILIVLFSSYFNSRIQTLRIAMHKVSLGDYNILKMLKGDDELTEIFNDLNTTVEKISEKEAKFYKSQLDEQQLINKQQHMEFKMLASQINPHFLYNTLEMIRMQALATGNNDVVTSIKLLAKSMRYVLENTGTDSTTLYDELEYVETYLAIQKLRFGDRINYSIQYPPQLDLDKYKILPLLLQPIIENSVIHGLERTKISGLVIINIILLEHDKLRIEVSDNGLGMDDDRLNGIIERINSASLDSVVSIGLYNINQRIKLFYGTEYGVTITSCPNIGTTVALTIPAIVNKEDL